MSANAHLANADGGVNFVFGFVGEGHCVVCLVSAWIRIRDVDVDAQVSLSGRLAYARARNLATRSIASREKANAEPALTKDVSAASNRMMA